jgi:hypothetical protein
MKYELIRRTFSARVDILVFLGEPMKQLEPPGRIAEIQAKD